MRYTLSHRSFRHAAALLATICIAAAAFGWGDETHRAISRGAAAILPDEMRPFFTANSEFIARHSTDPDYIPNRTPAQRAEHFFDLDAYAPPFKDLPHDRAEFEKKFGAAMVAQHGSLSWTINREYERLAKAFKDKDWAEARMAAATLSHFVADATIPLHATRNYNGRLTGNDGIYHRITVEMVGRYHNVTAIAPTARTEFGDPVEWTFKEIEKDLALCPALIKADNDARTAAPLDSEAYYLKLHDLTKTLVDERTRDAANAVAGFWTAAWQKAGCPALPPEREIVVLLYKPAPDPKAGPDAQKARMALHEQVIAQVAAKVAPFDAMAVEQFGFLDRAPRLSLHFVSACDVDSAAWKTAAQESLGRVSEAVDTTSRAFEQFPASRPRVLILLTDGWSADERLPKAVTHLKATGAKCFIFTFGNDAQSPAVKQFAADIGATFGDLNANADAASVVVKELALPPRTR